MTDQEKIFSWIEGLAQDDWRQFHSDSEVSNIAKAALTLLKEQEAMLIVRKWHKSELGDYSRLHCPKCDHEIEKPTFLERNEASYCPYCGQLVKWK